MAPREDVLLCRQSEASKRPWSPAKMERLASKESLDTLAQSAPCKLGLIACKLEGSKALPFVHIPQYKEKEFVEQFVVWRCSEEEFFWIIRCIDAVGALAFPEVE